MKATINGIIVEGTVDEIIEYQRKVNGYNPLPGAIKPDWTYRPQITRGGTTK